MAKAIGSVLLVPVLSSETGTGTRLMSFMPFVFPVPGVATGTIQQKF